MENGEDLPCTGKSVSISGRGMDVFTDRCSSEHNSKWELAGRESRSEIMASNTQLGEPKQSSAAWALVQDVVDRRKSPILRNDFQDFQVPFEITLTPVSVYINFSLFRTM